MSSGKPTREQADLAEVLELVLDKGIVINADIAVTVGETELLGIELRAAIASFETAAKYGLAFPSGTDMRRVERASGREPLEGEDGEPIDLGIDASSGGSAVEGDEEGEEDDGSDGQAAVATPGAPSRRPTPQVPMGGDDEAAGDDGGGDGGGTAPDESEAEDADGGESTDEESTDAEGAADTEASASDQSDDQTGDQEES